MRRLSLADPDALPDAGVLSAAQLRALGEASEIIRCAEAKAAAREAEQVARLEAALADATERAYADGMRDLAAAAAAYGAATDAISKKLSELLRECLVRVFRERPAQKVLMATVGPVLSGLTGAREIAVVVHPSRAEALEAAIVEAAGALSGAEVAVEIDPALGPEDCRIFTESDVINVGAPVVIDRLIGALSGRLAAAEKEAAQTVGGAAETTIAKSPRKPRAPKKAATKPAEKQTAKPTAKAPPRRGKAAAKEASDG